MADDARSGAGTGQPEISYWKEAFKSQYNWIGIAGLVGFSVLSGTALPLLLGAGIELMYLSVVPQMPRYQRLVRSRKYEEEKRRIQARLDKQVVTLPADMRQRYQGLQAVCATIRANYSELSATSQIFSRQMEERLDGLLQGFLRLLLASRQHEEYLKSASPEGIKREISQLQKSLASDPPKVQEINKRRIDILQKRLEKFGKIAENFQVITAQCSALTDVLALIRDQSVTMKDPEQVSNQLDGLVRDVEQTEETVRQMESIYDLAGGETTFTLAPPEAGGEGSSTPRRPVRNS